MSHTAPRRIRLAVALGVAAALALTGCAGGGGTDSDATASASSVPIPTGTAGAAHFDDGYLQVGEGATVVDVYFDPMCPICGVFEKTNGDQLASLVDAGTITLRLHPMTFLDRASQGTLYSTRADSALTCVAVAKPEATLDYLAALYENQPKENSKGLSDDELAGLTDDIGAPDIADCVAGGTYTSWAQRANDAALAGIEGADIPAIQGTPTVLVNGKSYQGPVNDAGALAEFIAAG
ncbi:DsbA family protein [Cryobacterium tepidiphilum]|uniref:DsbA family protein n=1 Tax=Cryobacterium tepidiphilum TaxID=2486026 RepID=A0A3M8LPB1_9MICO|nr:thioredoxin domain-containing protein [Cryobacterium tepidiphilum]RNE66554.1 DsbA family protein [Cryobacterium tepidiphilum]